MTINSNRDSQNINSSSKRPEKSNSYPKDGDICTQNGTLTRSSIANSNGDDPNLRSSYKNGRNATHSKSKEEKYDQENSENCDSESKEISKDKTNINRKEKLAISWMKSLTKLEAKSNVPLTQVSPGEEIPEFCCNKSCPISEYKIPETKKVLKLAQKINLRKTIFRDNDERWYCLKCLNAHNESLFCFYCGQIYFIEDNELEDDGKAWICCDDCSKWIHLDCDILIGKNMELKKHFKDTGFRYSCPECRNDGKSKNKRFLKGSQKKMAHLDREKSLSKQEYFDENSNSGNFDRNRDTTSQLYERGNHYHADSQIDDENQRSSDFCNSESDKKDSEMETDVRNQNGQNERTSSLKKKNKQLKRKNNYEKVKNNKRNHEEMSSQDCNDVLSIDEFTYQRSLKIAKEREDLIEPRTLFSKVYATIKAQDRCQQDVDFIISKIISSCLPDIDGQSNSPSKTRGHDSRGNIDMSSFKMTNLSSKSLNETDYSKRLRNRRSRKPNESQY